MKFNCILFDLDGTLINTNELILQSFRHVIKLNQGREFSSEEITQHFGEPLTTILERLAPGTGTQLVPAYLEFNQAKHDELTAAFPGTRETLSALKALGITLGVVTSKMKHMAHRGLQLFKLEEYFSVIVAWEDCANHKPEGEPVLKALEILEHKPEGVLYVGDSTIDIQCAQHAGVKSAAVMWSSLSRDRLLASGPDFLLQNMGELLDLV